MEERTSLDDLRSKLQLIIHGSEAKCEPNPMHLYLLSFLDNIVRDIGLQAELGLQRNPEASSASSSHKGGVSIQG